MQNFTIVWDKLNNLSDLAIETLFLASAGDRVRLCQEAGVFEWKSKQTKAAKQAAKTACLAALEKRREQRDYEVTLDKNGKPLSGAPLAARVAKLAADRSSVAAFFEAQRLESEEKKAAEAKQRAEDEEAEAEAWAAAEAEAKRLLAEREERRMERITRLHQIVSQLKKKGRFGQIEGAEILFPSLDLRRRRLERGISGDGEVDWERCEEDLAEEAARDIAAYMETVANTEAVKAAAQKAAEEKKMEEKIPAPKNEGAQDVVSDMSSDDGNGAKGAEEEETVNDDGNGAEGAEEKKGDEAKREEGVTNSFEEFVKMVEAEGLRRQYLVEVAMVLGNGARGNLLAAANKGGGISDKTLRQIEKLNRADLEAAYQAAKGRKEREEAEGAARKASDEKKAEEAPKVAEPANVSDEEKVVSDMSSDDQANDSNGAEGAEEKKTVSQDNHDGAKGAQKEEAVNDTTTTTTQTNGGTKEETIVNDDKKGWLKLRAEAAREWARRMWAATLVASGKVAEKAGIDEETRAMRKFARSVRKAIRKADGALFRKEGDNVVKENVLALLGRVAKLYGAWRKAKQDAKARAKSGEPMTPVEGWSTYLARMIESAAIDAGGAVAIEGWTLAALLAAGGENWKERAKATVYLEEGEVEHHLPMTQGDAADETLNVLGSVAAKVVPMMNEKQKKEYNRHVKACNRKPFRQAVRDGAAKAWDGAKTAVVSSPWLAYVLAKNYWKPVTAVFAGVVAGAVLGFGATAGAVLGAASYGARKLAAWGFGKVKGWWTNRKAAKATTAETANAAA